MDQGGRPGPAGKRLFLSYASADRARVAPIVAALTAQGYTVWWDRQIAGGSAYAREIEAALKGCDIVLVAWSAVSVDSDWVRDEAAYGRDQRRLVPLRLDHAEPPLGFRQYQLVSFAGWKGDPEAPQVHQLLEALQTPRAGSGPAPYAAPTSLETIGRRLLDRRALIAGGAVLVPAAAGAWWFLGRAGAAPAHSIAVLPFANLSNDPAQDYFSDGLSEELIDTLARLRPLEVVGRTSAFRFKGSKEGARQIGAKLGVSHLLDGAVRRDGATVRVSTQLVDAPTGFEQWSQSFDRDMKDILAVQSEIAQAVARALEVRLLGSDIAAFSLGGASSADAYDDYLRGRRLFDAGGSEAVYRRALARFDAAIARDPGFAGAHAARARALLVLANEYTPPAGLRAGFDAALAAARQATALAPDLAEAQAALAGVLASSGRDTAGARAAWARAMAAGSGEADILTRFGQFSCEIGDFAAGLPAARRAAVLDPLNPRVFRSLGYALFGARRWAESISAMRRALDLSPGAEGAHAAIGDALLLQGNAAGAKAEYDREPLAWLRLTGQAIALQRLGDRAGAEAALAALAADPHGATLYQQAQVLAQWRQPDRALAALAAAAKAGDPGVVLARTDPMVGPLRSDPRFAAFLAGLGRASTVAAAAPPT